MLLRIGQFLEVEMGFTRFLLPATMYLQIGKRELYVNLIEREFNYGRMPV